MVTHLGVAHGLGCLTSVIWPFTLTEVKHPRPWTIMTWVTIWRFIFSTTFTAHLSIRWVQFAPQKRKTKQRVNGQISEVKFDSGQYWDGWPFGDSYFFSQFYSFASNISSRELYTKYGQRYRMSHVWFWTLFVIMIGDGTSTTTAATTTTTEG